VLLSGDHAAIERWRLGSALRRTYERRPDLLSARRLSGPERTLLAEYFTTAQQ
jgi:tRNA (guanine37-N1)-methyltransferase